MPVHPSEIVIGPVRVGTLAYVRGSAESAARRWLGAQLGCLPAELSLVRDLQGRPTLDRPARDCNWSHSGDWLLVALGEGVQVGVDVEALRPRPKALEIATRYFHPAETRALAALPSHARDLAFLRLWCAKEAVLKAHGRGLAYGLDRIAVAGFAPGDGDLRLVATEGPVGRPGSWRLQQVPLDGAVAVVAWRTLA